jgi:hypothetical protein
MSTDLLGSAHPCVCDGRYPGCDGHDLRSWCGQPNDGSGRGPWCADCNPRRIAAISESLHNLREDFRMTDPFVPAEYFKFHKAWLDFWCDGQIHLLKANQDFPASMDLKDVMRRLKSAGRYRRTPVDVWPDGEGNLYLRMGPFRV